jgi:hypothetical protein
VLLTFILSLAIFGLVFWGLLLPGYSGLSREVGDEEQLRAGEQLIDMRINKLESCV